MGIRTATKAQTLVTGFGSFRNVDNNPSARLAERVGTRFQVLEVSYSAVDDFIESIDDSFEHLVLLGVAVGRTQITPELFARNFNGQGEDVEGMNRFGEIETDSPLLIESTLWSADCLSALFPNPDIRISYDAGEYLCNYVYYRALRKFPTKRIGFIHVPSEREILLDRQLQLITTLIDQANSL